MLVQPATEKIPVSPTVAVLGTAVSPAKHQTAIDHSELTLCSPRPRGTSSIFGSIQPAPGESPQAWSTRIVGRYLASSTAPASDTLTLHLPLSNWAYYSELQTELAKHFPNESDRPQILLTLRNSHSQPEKSMGILGGLGPLADASLIKQIEAEFNFGKAPTHSVEIKLDSNPHPPRNFLAALHLWALDYLHDIWNFVSQPGVDEFVLASNTAHIRLGLFNLFSRNRMFDGVSYVSNQLRQSSPAPARILVLGTTSAYEHELYPKALRNLGMNVATPTENEQPRVQEAIDLIKSGQIEVGQQKLSTVIRELANPPVSHVLLACTELPLALNTSTVHQALGYEAQVVDTSAIFAKYIAERLRL